MHQIDVIIPCYNYGRYLRDCVESVLLQKGVELRVLIIDDCSTDETERVGRQLASEDRRVEYRRHAINQGHIATYNEGVLIWAEAEYTVLLSADDVLLPGAFARASELLRDYPAMSFCHGKAVHTKASIPPEGCDFTFGPPQITPGMEYIRNLCRTCVNIVETPTAVVRTAIQKQAGGYEPTLPHTGDMEMWMRLASYGDVGKINGFQAIYRVHGQNMSRPYYAGVGDVEQRLAAFEHFARHRGRALPELADACAEAVKTVAYVAFWSASRRFDDGDKSTWKPLLELSTAIWPQLAETDDWHRFAMRRRIGHTSTALVRFLRNRLRSRPPTSLCQLMTR